MKHNHLKNVKNIISLGGGGLQKKLATFGQLPAFVNKVLLGDSHTQLSMAAFHHNGKAEQLHQRPYGPQSCKYSLSGSLQRKFADLWTVSPCVQARRSKLKESYTANPQIKSSHCLKSKTPCECLISGRKSSLQWLSDSPPQKARGTTRVLR